MKFASAEKKNSTMPELLQLDNAKHKHLTESAYKQKTTNKLYC